MKVYNYRTMTKILAASGYSFTRSNGGHRIFQNDNGKIVSISVHENRNTYNKILKQI